MAAATLLTGWLTASAWAQSPRQGIVTDGTSNRVIFSDPGALESARRNGKEEQWHRIVNDPRYRMQQMRRGLPMAGQAATPTTARPRAQSVTPWFFNPSDGIAKRSTRSTLHTDWSIQLGPPPPATPAGTRFGAPAKYSFSATDTPQCSDYVVFPIALNGSSTPANILGVNNLYASNPDCTSNGLVPTVFFAYNVGSGSIFTSMVLSLDGTKVAFVETTGVDPTHPGGNGSIFHVLQLGTDGNSGCPAASPCNGESFSTPVAPGPPPNDAVDTTIPVSAGAAGAAGTGGAITFNGDTSPEHLYLDYASDTAYFTDNNNAIHKITPVFNGTPAEVGSPWADLSQTLGVYNLHGPVFDSVSQRLFVADDGGYIRCFNADGTNCGFPGLPSFFLGLSSLFCPASTCSVSAIILDSTRGMLFANAIDKSEPVNNTVAQLTTDLKLIGTTPIGFTGFNAVRPAPNDAYFTADFKNGTTNGSTPYIYAVGGTGPSPARLALRRVGFNTSGEINSATDDVFVLQSGPATGEGIIRWTSTASQDVSGSNSCTVNLDTSTGTPNLILGSIGGTNANSANTPTISGGGTITSLFSNYSSNAKLQIWSITGFSASSTTSITFTTNGAAGMVCGASAFSGVGSVGCGPNGPSGSPNPCYNAFGTTSSSLPITNSSQPSVTVTNPGPGGIVFDKLSTASTGTNFSIIAVGAGQVQQWNLLGTGNRNDGSSVAPPRSSMNWTMNSTNTPWYLAEVPLIATPGSGQQPESTPPLEFLNINNTERVFLGLNDDGFTTPEPGCGGTGLSCLASFNVSSGSFPTAATGTLQIRPSGTDIPAAMSPQIIDNILAGGNIYFATPADATGRQVSQAITGVVPGQ
jgi:hypothetical protein